jgi:hypothetical protein
MNEKTPSPQSSPARGEEDRGRGLHRTGQTRYQIDETDQTDEINEMNEPKK